MMVPHVNCQHIWVGALACCRMQTTVRSQMGTSIGRMVQLYLDTAAWLRLTLEVRSMKVDVMFVLRSPEVNL